MTKLKTVYDFLKNIDICADILVYIYEDGNDAEPIYAGRAYETPYWVADLVLDWKHLEHGERPIDFRADLGKEYNHKPGFVILCTEVEDN